MVRRPPRSTRTYTLFPYTTLCRSVLLEVIRTELRNVKEEFGDDRRSEIRASEEELDILDLIAPEDVVVTLSHSGYAKRQTVSSYSAQKRGGRGRTAATTRSEESRVGKEGVRPGRSREWASHNKNKK